MTTYQPTGTGLCKVCGHDVGRHEDPAHRFSPAIVTVCAVVVAVDDDGFETRCCGRKDDPIHDIGRVLLCPKEEAI